MSVINILLIISISILLIISISINCYLALKITRFLKTYKKDQDQCRPEWIGYKNAEEVLKRWKES